MLEVNASFLVIFVQLWNEELLEHVQIHDTGNGCTVVKLFLKHPVYIYIYIVSPLVEWFHPGGVKLDVNLPFF